MTELKFYIHSLAKSLHSRIFYSELIRRNNIYGLKYTLFIALILSIPASLQVRYLLNSLVTSEAGMFHQISGNNIEKEIEYISAQVPKLIFERGKFKTNNLEPTYIRSKNGEPIAVIDTERNLEDLSTLGNIVLLRDTDMLILAGGKTSGIINAADIYQSFQNYFLINSEKVLQFNSDDFFRDFYAIITISYPAIFIFCFIWLGLRYFFKAILYSFIVGIFFSLMLKIYRFDFKQCVRISAFTSTPVALLEFISFTSGQNIFAYPNLVYFTTHLIYIYFAVESFRKMSQK